MMKTKRKRGRCKRLDDPMAFAEIPGELMSLYILPMISGRGERRESLT
jgi:hypothetical protein